MRIYLDCILCFMQQALRAGRMVTSDEKKLKKILDKIKDKLLTAIQIAIVGNVIDLGVKKL